MNLRVAALCTVLLASNPAFALDVPPRAAEILRCGIAFQNHSDALKETGDTGGANEFLNRGAELVQRATFMLQDAGFAADAIENVVMNTVLTASFEYGAGPDELMAECLNSVADDDSP